CQNQTITSKDVETYMPKINVSFDASEDGYYNALSAFQKSIRGSDVDAALFYLAYLALANDLESIERRLLVTAYEDIGLANPACVARTINAIDTAKRVGFPEALIPLGLQVIDLTLSPKSRSAHDAIKKAYATVESTSFHIPEYLKLTPVGLKENETYDYSRSDLWHHIQYLPKNLKDKTFYQPLPSSNYEKQLLNNYQQLQKYYRSNQLSKLYQEHKSPRK
ncbi:MAG: replication-associated recombination protein A, partial [Erysipelotrichaceae bacterium]|nr:replication-associated recombination protein A [Erysipelotrichaceae bacterium]